MSQPSAVLTPEDMADLRRLVDHHGSAKAASGALFMNPGAVGRILSRGKCAPKTLESIRFQVGLLADPVDPLAELRKHASDLHAALQALRGRHADQVQQNETLTKRLAEVAADLVSRNEEVRALSADVARLKGDRAGDHYLVLTVAAAQARAIENLSREV